MSNLFLASGPFKFALDRLFCIGYIKESCPGDSSTPVTLISLLVPSLEFSMEYSVRRVIP
jgi:hypothetical protein